MEKYRSPNDVTINGRNLSDILAEHARWVESEEDDDQRADLRGAKMSGVYLKDINLRDADLRGAMMDRVVLDGADLSVSDLSDANLSKASLIGASLNKAVLIDTNFNRANLSRAQIRDANLTRADLGGAELIETDFFRSKLIETDLIGANMQRANLNLAVLNKAMLIKADLSEANLNEASLVGTLLSEATMIRAELIRANLTHATLIETNLSRANLVGATLRETNLQQACLVKANMENATISGCRIYGISAWDLNLNGSIQKDLIITSSTDPDITVDNLELAQFLYFLIHNQNVHSIFDTITSMSNVVLILGKFPPHRRDVVDAIREALRKRNYFPVLFDFSKAEYLKLSEAISTLSRWSRFIIADITSEKNLPDQLGDILSHLPSITIQPLSAKDHVQYEVFENFKQHPWVLPIYIYKDTRELLASIGPKIIEPAEAKAKENHDLDTGKYPAWKQPQT